MRVIWFTLGSLALIAHCPPRLLLLLSEQTVQNYEEKRTITASQMRVAPRISQTATSCHRERSQRGCNDGDGDADFASAGHDVMANKGETGFDSLLYSALLRLRPSLLAITNCILDEADFWDVFSPGVPEKAEGFLQTP